MLKLIFSILLLVISLQAKEYKALFDCSSQNAQYIKTRIWLIGKTMDMIEKKVTRQHLLLHYMVDVCLWYLLRIRRL